MCFFCRNLPHRVAEADSGQICTRRVSGQQCSGHKCPPDHWWAERQQTPVLPEPVTLHDTHLHIHHPHHITRALFPTLPRCSAHSQLPRHSILFSFSAFYSVLHRTAVWTHSCSSLPPWKQTSRSLYVTWSVELSVESMWRFLQCRNKAVSTCLKESLRSCCRLTWTETLVEYREVVKYISMVTTRWCCVNKLQAVYSNLVKQYYASDSVVLILNFPLTSDKLSCQKFPHYVFIEEYLAYVVIVLL